MPHPTHRARSSSPGTDPHEPIDLEHPPRGTKGRQDHARLMTGAAHPREGGGTSLESISERMPAEAVSRKNVFRDARRLGETAQFRFDHEGAGMMVTSANSSSRDGLTRPSQAAHEVHATLSDGRTVPGYLIRTDVVLVLEPGVQLPATATVGGRRIAAVEAIQEREVEQTLPSMTALRLPSGTVRVEGERTPPGTEAPASGCRPGWRWLFPRLR